MMRARILFVLVLLIAGMSASSATAGIVGSWFR